MEREDEDKRLDRQWYSMDDGYDNTTNDPFGGMSDEYMRRKEQELEQKKKKKMSAQQRQIQKVIIIMICRIFLWSVLCCCFVLYPCVYICD